MMRLYSIFVILLGFLPAIAAAAWQIVTHTDTDTNTDMRVAYIENKSGYTLEIYRDAVGAVRSRFTLMPGLSRLANHNCPTYQIDKRQPQNRSINDAPCIPESNWAEFILGYIENNEVTSVKLHELMNGTLVTYRFALENGGYRETNFSLVGSKKAFTAALGEKLRMKPR
ncbi:MAG: hypothetical protein A2W28_08105 [Gammaproteobacteria bacterium RBG_16_51_14]|nr:MAG: hypothetical protein A2W28_08105 [Gammaproteobacteria bacterium RBG_16_51_14]